MTATTRREKPARTIRLLHRRDEASGCFAVTEGKRAATYFFEVLPCDYGRAYRVEKVGPTGAAAEVYDVNVGDEEGPAACECKSWLYRGYCKHVSGLTALINAGRI